MGRRKKLLFRILRGTSDTSIPFISLCNLLKFFGFSIRIKGSHHIFTHPDIVEILNLQPKGTCAKPYQVKQVREVILKYHLGDVIND